jgi:hypothetical protein
MTITRSLLVVGILLSQIPNSAYAGGHGGSGGLRSHFDMPTRSSNPYQTGPGTGGNLGSNVVYAPNGGANSSGGYTAASRQYAYTCTIRQGEPDAGDACTVYTSLTKRYGDHCKCSGQSGFID